jgi:hypothetical protein
LCKALFTVPWVTPAWHSQLSIPHLPIRQPVSILF